MIVTISALAFGAVGYGWWGMMLAGLLLAVLGCMLPYKGSPDSRLSLLERIEEQRWEKIDHARRGDPTRPDEDHPLLITHEIKSRR